MTFIITSFNICDQRYKKPLTRVFSSQSVLLSPHIVYSMSSLHITTQFTEDMYATAQSSCDRCKAVINPGQPRIYIAPQGQPNQPGKHVCEDCFSYYCKKPSTTARVVRTSNAGQLLLSH